MENISQLSPWQRLIGLLNLEKRDIFQILYYAIFDGVVALSLPLGIQAIINLIQGAQISTSWVVLVIIVTIGVVFSGALQLMQLRIIETIQQRIFTRAARTLVSICSRFLGTNTWSLGVGCISGVTCSTGFVAGETGADSSSIFSSIFGSVGGVLVGFSGRNSCAGRVSSTISIGISVESSTETSIGSFVCAYIKKSSNKE